MIKHEHKQHPKREKKKKHDNNNTVTEGRRRTMREYNAGREVGGAGDGRGDPYVFTSSGKLRPRAKEEPQHHTVQYTIY